MSWQKLKHPDYLYIGCSDSRATAEELMGAKPGEVFVHRNIANVVNTLDMSSTAVIQYAVEHLKVKHIIVMWTLQLRWCKSSDDSSGFRIIESLAEKHP
jgi:carbonic anhydrase